MYYWGGNQNGTTAYENLTYLSYDKQTPESTCRLICVYEDMVTNPAGTRKMPPPGICAEYGYLLLLPETPSIFHEAATNAQKRVFQSTDYAELFRERGLKMLEMEMSYYPESIIFIKPLYERLRGNE